MKQNLNHTVSDGLHLFCQL